MPLKLLLAAAVMVEVLPVVAPCPMVSVLGLGESENEADELVTTAPTLAVWMNSPVESLPVTSTL